MVDLVGRKSNRDAIGAEVKVTTGAGRTLFNNVNPSVGFMSSSDRRLHFGLAGETKIQSIEVRWPSGQVQKVMDVVVDKVVRLEEPK